MVYCVVPNCKNGSETGRGMFTFPKKSANPKLNLLWRKNMGRAASDSPFKLWENTATSRLCDEHFEEHCFIPPSPRFARSIGFRPGKFQLVSGAVPTIFNKRQSNQNNPEVHMKRDNVKRYLCIFFKQLYQIYFVFEHLFYVLKTISL